MDNFHIHDSILCMYILSVILIQKYILYFMQQTKYKVFCDIPVTKNIKYVFFYINL